MKKEQKFNPANVTNAVNLNVTNTKIGEETDMMQSLTNLLNGIQDGSITKKALDDFVAENQTSNEATETQQETPKRKRNRPRKAYSEWNVRIMKQMIDEGKTSLDIKEKYDICRETVHDYLKIRHAKRPAKAEEYWKKLLANDRAAKINDADVEDINDVVSDIEEQTAEGFSGGIINTGDHVEVYVTPDKFDFVIDSQLVQRHAGRQYLKAVIDKITATGSSYCIFSVNKMHEIIDYSPTGAAAECARECLDKFCVYDTSEKYLNMFAQKMDSCVITCSNITEDICERFGVKCVMADEFLSEVEDYTSVPIDEARKYTLPCKMNKNRRMICNIDELAKSVAKIFNLESVSIEVHNFKGCKTSPYGAIRLEVGDFILFESMSNNHYYQGQLEVIAEAESANAIQRFYCCQPVSCMKREKNGTNDI